MIDSLQRINELAKKQREQGLTNAEKVEQQVLRDDYLHVIRKQVLHTFSGMKVLDPLGNDVTPEKVRNLKRKGIKGKDYLVKAIAHNKQVRAYVAITTETIEEVRRRHDLLAVASVVLGRSMTAGVILGAMLKGEEKLTINMNGGGPIGTILVDANAKGEVRGYVSNPHAYAGLNQQGLFDIQSAVGTNGILSVTKDIGLNQPFIGQVPIASGEIGEDFASYLLHSEQIASSVGVGVLVNSDFSIQAAGGFIIQLLPNTEEKTIRLIEERLQSIPSISSMIGQGATPELLLNQLLGEENINILETIPVQFRCECSRDRTSDAIVCLGSDEIQDMIETDGQAEAQCHYCNQSYHYTKADLETLVKKAVS